MRIMTRKYGLMLFIVMSGVFILGTIFFSQRVESGERPGTALVQKDLPADFTHDATSFSLQGRHKQLKCSQCHLGGQYKGLPTTCENCHNGRIAYGKPVNHVMTSKSCDTCHKPSGWVPAAFTHDLATVTGQCSTCHNGQRATGKPQNHISTTQQCDTCHKPTGWVPATYTNHDNPKLIGAHTPLECKVCHTQSFSTAFYRDGTQYGSCANCHTRDYKYPGPGEHRNAGATLADSLRANAGCANCHKHAGYRGF